MALDEYSKWIVAAIWDSMPEGYVANKEVKDRVIKTFSYFAKWSELPENVDMKLEYNVVESSIDGRGTIQITIDAIDLYKPELISSFAEIIKEADVVSFSAHKEFVVLELCFNNLYIPFEEE